MKKNRKFMAYKFIWLFLTCFLWGACMSDSINIDPDKILESNLEKDNLWGTYLTTMQRRVVPEDVNDFQRSEDLFGSMYAGYFAGTQNWVGGRNATTYVFSDQWHERPFKVAYVDLLSSWNILRQKVDSTSILFAVGEIVKVAALHKTTDMYGPLPYKKFGLVNPVPYDSQKDIYESFFKELDHAIDVLVKFNQINPNSKSLLNFDLIYSSDIPNWIRFANSLKLRLAVRIRYVEPGIAQDMAEEALSHSFGVIEDNSGNATVQDNANLTYIYSNPMYGLWNGYGEDCMGATMDSYLNGYEDPRRPVYFQATGAGVYRGLRNGHQDGDKFKDNANLSKPNILRGTPYQWMTAAEVYFLRAEGAMLLWNMKGNAEELYKQGIRKSFDLCKIDTKTAENYLENTTNAPIKYPGFSSSPSKEALSNITIAWKEGDADELKLERIITQKWIAMYPTGQEAWSEFRRTGYPKIFPVVNNLSDGVISTEIQVRRIPFPESEYSGNKAEVDKAIVLLGGPDNGGTKLWWDVKSK